MANKRFIDFPIASTVGDNDIILIWQGGANKQTTKATILSGVPDSLNDLTDVTISGLTNGQILRYDSVTGQWENTDQGNLDLNDLNDVTIVSPTNGQVLVYNSSTSKWENSSGGYVPYVGAVTTVDLGLQGLEAGYVRFDTSIVSVPDEQGLMYWDASRSTVALIMNGTLQHIGQDTFFYVKNSTGSSIPKGTCVRFAGTDGASGHLLITPFLANGSVPSTYFIGVTAEEITNGSFGQVMHFGELEGINTSSYTAGDLLYASTTVAGAFQTTAPVAPNNIVLVAAAVNSKNNGAIVVRPTYGSNINNDEGVKITSPTTGDLLQLQAGGLWENKTIDAAGIVTKATNQTITGVKTFSQDIIVNGVNVGRGGGNAVENTSTGNSALSANTTGSGNTANGSFALFKNTSGSGNTAVGTQSLTENTTGSGNTGLGWASLYKNTSGSNNSALGYLSLYENTTGQTNVGIGFYALFKNTTGNDNTALGYTSGAYIADGSTANSISNNSIYIGAYTKALANNQTNQIVIGHNAIGGGSNTVVIGNSSILSNRFFGTMRIGTINNGVGDFITTDANGVLTKRTGAEVRTDIGAGTVTSVAALTLGTSGTDLSSTVANGTTTPVITLNVPTASATNRGALSAADWTTFNNKQNALTNPVTGTGTTNYLPKFTGSTTIGDSQIVDDGTTIQIGNIPLGGKLNITNGNANLNIYFATLTSSAWNSSLFLRGGSSTSTSSLNLGYSGSDNDAYIRRNSDGRLSLGTSQNDKLSIFFGGNVFVGSSVGMSDNGAKLQVSGTGHFTANLSAVFNSTSNTPYIRFDESGSAKFFIGQRSIVSGAAGTGYDFYTTSGNDLQFFTGGSSTSRLTIATTGAATFSSPNSIVTDGSSLNINIRTTTAFGADIGGTIGLGGLFNSTLGTEYGVIAGKKENSTINNIAGYLAFYTRGGFTDPIERMRITSSGLVGINTINPGTVGTGYGALTVGGSSGGGINFAATGSAFGQVVGDTGGLYVTAIGNRPIILNTNDNPRVTVTGGGNVLIGTPPPADNGARLQVSGGSRLLDLIGGGDSFARVTGNRGNANDLHVANLEFYNSNSSRLVGEIRGITGTGGTQSNSGQLAFYTNDNGTYAERMRITSSGNVLIGTQSEDARLTVQPFGSNYAQVINHTNATNQFFISFRYNTATIGTITGNNTNVTYATSSDYRLKTDFKNFNGLDLVSKIKTYDFAWKINNSRMFGVVAHELQDVINYAVTGQKDGESMQGVDYSKLVPIMVKAIQELKQEIDTLKN